MSRLGQWLSSRYTPVDLHVRRIPPVFTILFALAFSLAVCALIGVAVTTGFDRLMDYVRATRDRAVREKVTQRS